MLITNSKSLNINHSIKSEQRNNADSVYKCISMADQDNIIGLFWKIMTYLLNFNHVVLYYILQGVLSLIMRQIIQMSVTRNKKKQKLEEKKSEKKVKNKNLFD